VRAPLLYQSPRPQAVKVKAPKVSGPGCSGVSAAERKSLMANTGCGGWVVSVPVGGTSSKQEGGVGVGSGKKKQASRTEESESERERRERANDS
jgi:hypothetical protein